MLLLVVVVVVVVCAMGAYFKNKNWRGVGGGGRSASPQCIRCKECLKESIPDVDLEVFCCCCVAVCGCGGGGGGAYWGLR